MSLIVLYFLHSTSVLSFYTDVVLTLSIIIHFNVYIHITDTYFIMHSIYWYQSYFTEAVEMIVCLPLDNNVWSVFMASDDRRTIRLSEMEFPVLVRWLLYIEMVPETPSSMVRHGVWFPCPSLPLVANTSSGLSPSQWETSLQCNTISHWLAENLESALIIMCDQFNHRQVPL